MADKLESIVQGMIDAGESEEDIASVIKEYSAAEKQRTEGISEPTSFGEGVLESLSGGEAIGAGLKGAKGFARGAVLDLPASIGGALRTIGGMVTSPRSTSKEVLRSIKDIPSQFAEAVMMSGSEPESFGRMMGQFTGQPLATAGISRIPPKPIIRALGRPIEATGRVTKSEGFISGIMPPITTPRYLKYGERMIGRGLERIGKRMKQVGMVTEEPYWGDPSKAINITPSRRLPEAKARFEAGKGVTYDLSKPLSGEAAIDAESLRRAEEFVKSKKSTAFGKSITSKELNVKGDKIAGSKAIEDAIESAYSKAKGSEIPSEFKIPVVRREYTPADYSTDIAHMKARGETIPSELEALAQGQKPLNWQTDPWRKINQQRVIESKKSRPKSSAEKFNPASLKFD